MIITTENTMIITTENPVTRFQSMFAPANALFNEVKLSTIASAYTRTDAHTHTHTFDKRWLCDIVETTVRLYIALDYGWFKELKPELLIFTYNGKQYN